MKNKMKKEKYGIIYLWYDRGNKKYYLGRHWGTEDDGYICSSPIMKKNYNCRPEDFKRKILSRIYTSNDDLIKEEQRWLNMIKPSECIRKYYNKTLSSTTPSTRGYKHSEKTRKKISDGNKGKIISENTKVKLSKSAKTQFENSDLIDYLSKKSSDLWKNPEYIMKQNKARSRAGFYQGFKGKHSDETRNKMSKVKIGISYHNNESKQKISKHFSNSIWVNNGVINMRISNSLSIPEGFSKGRLKKN